MHQETLAKVEMWESEKFAFARTSAADQRDTLLGPHCSSGMSATTSQLHEAVQTWTKIPTANNKTVA